MFHGQKTNKFLGHQDTITGLLAIDSQRFVSTSRDKTIKIWNIE